MSSKFEKLIFRSLGEQARHINTTFKELGKSIDAWLNHRPEDVAKSNEIITHAEHTAKSMKKKMLEEASQAEANIHRSDFIRLILQLDEVASYQGGAASRLGRISFQPVPDDPMAAKFRNLVTVFLEMGDVLTNAIKMLGENNKKALEYCEKIDDVEEKIDDVYRDLEAHLYSRNDLDIRLIMQIRTVALHIEEACDIVNKLADGLHIILAVY
jgi:predicted phosphate transport protein (TIGR00153 family)